MIPGYSLIGTAPIGSGMSAPSNNIIEADDTIVSTATSKIKGLNGPNEGNDTLAVIAGHRYICDFKLPYSAPAANTPAIFECGYTNLTFNFVRPGYTVPLANNVQFNFYGDVYTAVSTITEGSDALTSTAQLKIRSQSAWGGEWGGPWGGYTIVEDDDVLLAGNFRVGSVNATEANDSIAATAIFKLKGYLAVTEENDTLLSSSGNIRAISSIAEANDSLVATSTIKLKASGSISENNDSLSSTSVIKIRGTDATTEGNDTLSAVATVKIKSAAAITEAADTLVSASTLSFYALHATVAITEAGDSLASPTKLRLNATTSLIDSDDSTSTAIVKIKANATPTEANDSVSAVSRSPIRANGSLTEGSDTVTSSGHYINRAYFAVTEDNDTLADHTSGLFNEEDDGFHATAKLKLAATTAFTDSDSLTVTAKTKIRASNVATEGSDTFSATSFIKIKATVAPIDQADTVVSASNIDLKGAGALTEGNDSLGGTSRVKVVGQSAIGETDDALSSSSRAKLHATASLFEFDDLTTTARIVVHANSNKVEESDSISSHVYLSTRANANLIEGSDICASTCIHRPSNGVVEVNEEDDQFSASGLLPLRAVGSLDDVDIVSSTGTVQLLSSISLAEQDDTSHSTAKIATTGRTNLVETDDSILSGNHDNRTIEENDSVSASIKMISHAIVAFAEQNDGIVIHGKLKNKGHVSGTEGPDVITSRGRFDTHYDQYFLRSEVSNVPKHLQNVVLQNQTIIQAKSPEVYTNAPPALTKQITNREVARYALARRDSKQQLVSFVDYDTGLNKME